MKTRTKTTKPAGAFRKNTHRHVVLLQMIPPSRGPSRLEKASVLDTMAAYVGYTAGDIFSGRITNVKVEIPPPPMPWKARKTTLYRVRTACRNHGTSREKLTYSCTMVCAKPHPREKMMKTATQKAMVDLRPNVSLSLATTTREPTSLSVGACWNRWR